MRRIEVLKSFMHADNPPYHPVEFTPGLYTVGENMTDRCADVALAEGWAVLENEKSKKKDGSPTGTEKPASSSRPGPASKKRNSKK